MFTCRDLSDVTFVVEEEEFPAHKFLLVTRSKYFRAMFLGGLKERNDDKVVLKETSGFAFRALLWYIYTGTLSLIPYDEKQVLEILKVAHMYDFVKLEKAIVEYLKTILNTQNVCEIFNLSLLYSLFDLRLCCISFTVQNIQPVLASQGLVQLPANALTQLLSPCKFYVCAITLFRAVREWIMAHQDLEVNTEEMVMTCVPLPHINRQDLLKEVRQSGLVKADTILDAIEKQDNRRDSNERRRNFHSKGGSRKTRPRPWEMKPTFPF
nr:BTB:POZ and BTB Kelch-associated domain containing protein [Haemonchus contortus]